MDDIQVVRIEEMFKELSSGQFPVRIAMDLANGSGYMLFNFYAPFVYYLGAFFHFLGFTLVISTKLTFLSGFIVAWFGIYLLLRLKIDAISTFFGSILFFASSYLGYDVYHRGALAEFYALSILPLLFWAYLKLTVTKSPFFFAIASAMTALLIITHNLTAFITLPLLALITILISKKDRQIEICAFLLGLMLSAFYWLPAITESRYIILNQVDFIINTYKNHFLTISQLIGFQSVSWGFRPPLLGISLFLGTTASLVILIFKPKICLFKVNKVDSFIKFSIFAFFFSLLMASSLGKVFWEVLAPFLKYIQFPWRFLTLATFFGVISTAFFISVFKSIWVRITVGIILCIPLFILQKDYLRPIGYNYISKYTADDPCGTAGWSDEYIPIWVKKCRLKSDQIPLLRISNGNLLVKKSNIDKHSRKYELKTTGKGTVTFDKYYFPGWSITIDGEKTQSIISSNSGMIAIKVPDGNHDISLNFIDTPIRSTANLISFLGIFLFFSSWYFLPKRRYR